MTVNRIAYLNPASHLGGAELSLLELVANLNGSPHVLLIVPAEGDLSAAARNLGVDVVIVPVPAVLLNVGEVHGKSLARAVGAVPALLIAAFRVRRALRMHDVQLLITNGIKAHVYGTLGGAAAGVPVIWHMRDSLEQRRISRLILRMIARWSKGAIAISHYVSRELSGGTLSQLPRRVVYNPVNRARFHPDTRPAGNLPVKGDDVWVGVIGPLTPLKGQDIFIRAASLALDTNQSLRFFIVGANPYHTERQLSYSRDLVTLAGTLGIKKHVHFLGWRTDIEAVLASLDIVVQSNRGPEGLGRAVLEAMASGKAVVAVNKWGPAEIIADGVTGLLVPVEDNKTMAQAILRLASDPDYRGILGRNARAWVDMNLNESFIVSAFRSAIAELAEGQ